MTVIAQKVELHIFSDKRWMSVTNEIKQKWINTISKRPYFYAFCVFALYVLINNTINASSDWIEANRGDGDLKIAVWEPFVWEYTSAISTFIFIPFVVWWFRFLPFSLSKITRFILSNLAASLVFSLAHVVTMVILREGIYHVMGKNYDFGNIFSEFFYEYRKDAWGFLFFMGVYYAARFIYSRLTGEASLIEEQANTHSDVSQAVSTPEHLLVKKLDKEFLVKVSDIEWLEASGNYVNLHALGRIYPLRSTLSGLLPKIALKGFVQTHRSYGVNLDKIESISTLPSGDGEIHLKGGKTLSLSRRYKENFKSRVSH